MATRHEVGRDGIGERGLLVGPERDPHVRRLENRVAIRHERVENVP